MKDQLEAAVIANPSMANLSAYSDWCEEHGELELAKALRDTYEHKIALQPVREAELIEILSSHDWLEVFGEEGNSGNTNGMTEACPPGSDVSLAAPIRKDIKEVIASVNGEPDGGSWTGVFLLHDGRYLLADGSCDYTGWD